MAFSIATVDKTVFGNKQVRVLSCVADAATAAIVTGLDAVNFIQYTPKSMATASAKFAINALAAGTAAAGTVAVSGIASGDEFFLTVYGR